MTRQPHEDVATLSAALRWLERAWSTLPVPPVRVHVRDIEDKSALGSHRFSGPMWRIITGRPTDDYDVTESVMCGHPRLVTDNPFDCRDCLGAGFYEHRVRRYRSPMAAALHRLSKVPAPSDGTPAPIEFIYALYEGGWGVQFALYLLGFHAVSPDHQKTLDAQFLLAIRQLHSRYSAGPVARPGWVDLSESQRNAEDGEAA
jgi:hypothetical protein